MKNKILLNNILSLGTLQIVNYAIPLITTPYVIRIIGLEKFGLIAFATAVVGYFQLLIDYGFNLTATQAISIHRNQREKVNQIFSSVISIKLKLVLVSIIFLGLLCFTEKFQTNWILYSVIFFGVFGQAIFPTWLFQGLEKMKFITLINVSFRLLSTIALFLFVKSKNDFLIVPLLTSISAIFSGITGLLVVKFKLGVKFKFQPYKTQKFYFKDGWHVFASTVTMNLYTTSTILILGLFTSNYIVGMYSGAEKIIRVFKGLNGSITQALFPHASDVLNQDLKQGVRYIKRLGIKIALANLILSALIFIFSPSIVLFVIGTEFPRIILLLRIMCLVPFITSISNILGIQLMLNLGFKKQFNLILLCCAIFSVTANFLFIPSMKEVGATIILLTTEVLVTVTMYTYMRRNRVFNT